METAILPAYDMPEITQTLFREYTDMLVANDHAFAEYLKLQNYGAELEHLENKYGMPSGRLYLLFVGQQPAGCIALRKLDDDCCEIKRLYIRPAFRGHHYAERLVTKLIAEAKTIGYKKMLLDTLPFLKAAILLYKKLGFYEIKSYNNSPLDDTIYMQLDLT